MSVYKKRRWFVNFWHDYEPLFSREPGRWNWIDWTLISVTFEHAEYVPRDELTVALLGFHVDVERWRHPISKTDPYKDESLEPSGE